MHATKMSNSAVPMEQTESDPPLRDQIPTWLDHTHWLNTDVNYHCDYKFCLDIINRCSVCNKQIELEAVIAFHILEFVIGTKSDLDNSFLNAEVFPSHYNVYIYRWDRNIHGGGVFILIKHRIIIPSVAIINWINPRLCSSETHTRYYFGMLYCLPMALISDLLCDTSS